MSDSIMVSFGSARGEDKLPSTISPSPASGGWFRALSCSLSGVARRAHTTRGDAETEAGPVVIAKLTDGATIGILREALMGNFKEPVTIAFVRTTTGEPTEYMRVELTDCGIVAFDMQGGADDRMTETYSIRWSEMTIKTWHFDRDNNKRGSQAVVTIRNEAGPS